MTSSITESPMLLNLGEAESETFLAVGRRVIAREAEALTALGAALGPSFAQAVALILQARGRIIISGMGKSGHIGRKIAATFASTGTPAQFVHPAEASHGDLGMIAEGDVILMLSNSGETPELADMLAHSRRFSIPLIGVAGREDSTLLREADVAILLPKVEEACGTGIVPTTSTTMTLALGDALAIALMEHRHFTPDHFRVFHPGGKLGARLLRVRDLMHREAPLVAAETPMSEALLTMTRAGFGVVGVADNQRHLLGIVTDGDLRRHMEGLLSHAAGEVMTRTPLTATPDMLAVEALAAMNARKITCLMVVSEEGEVMGVLHIHDLLRAGVA